MKPSLRPSALILPAATAGPRLPAAGWRSVAPGILLRGALPVSSRELDLELVELIPLGIGPLPLRDRLELLQAGAGGNWRLGFVHRDIISFFDHNAIKS
jgi:hypothetical protein